MTDSKSSHVIEAEKVFEIESQAILSLKKNLDGDFDRAIELIINAKGKTIVCGMGKSGLIGQKISATLSSTGTASFFMHPSEAIHGDLGRISSSDIFIAISHSGETEEVIRLIPFLIDNQNPIIGISGNNQSTLALNCTVHLLVNIEQEACPLKLAPTSSTTATLAMGDALAVALMVAKNFQPEQFARFHPGGSLGRKLLTKVKDVMRKDSLPMVNARDPMEIVIQIISSGRVGMVIVGTQDKLEGVITDGDIRRTMGSHREKFLDIRASEIMSRTPKSLAITASVQEAIDLMNQHSITAILATKDDRVCGIVQLFDCNL
ncbi:MAG: arabinose-5-phosphate isomerase [Motiliproteus sp.]|jgi:arabinose-5-phosphate isomerase